MYLEKSRHCGFAMERRKYTCLINTELELTGVFYSKTKLKKNCLSGYGPEQKKYMDGGVRPMAGGNGARISCGLFP